MLLAFGAGLLAGASSPPRSLPDRILLGTVAGLALAAWCAPQPFLALRSLLRTHAGWLLGVCAWTALLLDVPADPLAPGTHRMQWIQCLRTELPRIATFLCLAAAGFLTASVSGSALAAAAGTFLLAPLLAAAPVQAPPTAGPGVPSSASRALRASLIALLLLAALPANTAPAPPLLALAAAAAASQAVRILLPPQALPVAVKAAGAFWWIAAAGTILWIAAIAGPPSGGLAFGAAGLELLARRLRLPALARLVFWAPFLC